MKEGFTYLYKFSNYRLLRFVIIGVLLFSFNTYLTSQCGESVNAGEDVFLCESENGETIILSGSVSGNPLFTTWAPNNLVDDPTSLVTTATVTETTVFELSALYVTNNELVVNGDFESGNIDFISDYSHSPTTLWPESVYAVIPNANTLHSNFAACPDHTSGSGNMMVINGSSTPNENVWCQTINVIPGTFYAFSVWVCSVNSGSPARLEFSINGLDLGAPILATSTTCQWAPFFTTWQADVTTAEICIVNQNTAASGNDFALDDISFRDICQESDFVNVYVDDMMLSLSEPDDLDCENSELDISATYSSPFGDDFIINWATTDGNIQGDGFDATVTVDEPGTYTFTFFNFVTGCVLTDEVIVGGDNSEPTIDAGENVEIDCTNTTVELAGNTPDDDSNYTYSWTTPDGNIVSDEDSLNPTVDAPGTYVLVVTNDDNGCTSSSEVDVLSIADLPDAMAISEGILNCETDMVNLNGLGSTEGDDFSYNWTTSNGNIISGSDGLNPVVDMPGNYTLIVTNNVNGCTQLANVQVEQDVFPPTVSVEGPIALNCTFPTATILGNDSSVGDNFMYQWTSSDGNILSDETDIYIEIDMPGTYTLLVTNTENGCTSSLPFTMEEDFSQPEVEILPSPELNCLTTQIDLQANVNDSNGNYTYFWSSPNGNLVAGENSLNPSIDQIGTYEILVTNSENGCTSIEEIEITENLTTPEIELAQPLALDCINTSTILQATDILGNGNTTFSWTTNNGNIVSGDDSDIPVVDAAGTYTLISTNTENGCTSSLDIIVDENVAEPNIELSSPDLITCSVDEILLSANSNSSNIAFLWNTSNGNILNGADSASPLVNSTGVYEVVVIDLDNGCSSIETIEVFENISEPNVDAGENLQLTCDLESLNLAGTSNNNGSYSYSWITANGSIQNGQNSLNPEINAAGIYTLIITDESNGCTSSDEVEVSQDLNAPNADAGPSTQLDCQTTSVNLDASASSAGPDISFIWTTQNGNFVSGQNSLTPEVNQAGTYLLTVINSANNCSTVSSVTIDENIEPPLLDLGQNGILDCNNSELLLFNQSTNSSNLVYTWSSDDGSFIDGSNPGEIIVNEAGEYFVTVINWDNGCETSAVINITEDIETPLVEAGLPATLDCSESSLQLNGLAIGPSGSFTYEWTTSDGNIISGEDSLFPLVDQAGTYTLNVLNINNGCEGSSSVVIDQNADAPLIDISNPQELNCLLQSQILDASNSSIGSDFIYEWTTTNGNINSGTNSLMPEIDAAGTYQLLITNTANGCSNFEEIIVEQNIDIPLADGIALDDLSCTNETVVLEANTFGASNIEYLWSTSNGNILGGLTGSSTEVDQAGIYLLIITSLDNQCSSTVEIIVEQDADTPIAAINPAENLTCNIEQIQLDGSGSSQGNNIEFTWTTANGNFVSGTNTLTPEIDQAGSYTLSIIDMDNGCETNSTIIIDEDNTLPEVDLSTPSILNCNVQIATIGAISPDPNADLSYEWTLSDGTLLQGPIINVISPGIVNCTVVNLSNGCSNNFTTEVFEDVEAPMALAEEPLPINCLDLTSILNASQSSSGVNFTYLWSSQTGNIVNGANTLNPEVDATGIYTLNISNSDNGCESEISVEVFENIEEPIIITELPEIINCVNEDVDLVAVIDIPGNYTYSWSTIDGSINGSLNALAVNVNSEGIYNLLVTNQDNGCTAMSSLEVLSDLEVPVADAGNNYELTCDETQLQLIGTASSTGPEFEYLWTTINGSILQDENTLMPLVDEPAFYTLTVTNSLNGCSASSTIEVLTSQDNPSVIIAQPEILTCDLETVSIFFSVLSANDDIEIEWSAISGNILPGTEQTIPLVNQPGIYQVVITDLVNGCTNTEQIEVLQDIESPNVDAGPTAELTCTINEIELTGTGSSGNEFEFLWTSNNGNLLGGQNTLNPLINSAGSYLLSVVNTNNGCTAEDLVLITRNENVPTSIETLVEEPFCFGDRGSIEFTSVIGGEGPFLYSIDDGENFFSEDSFDQLVSGTYDLLIQDLNGCRLSDILVIPEVLPIDVDLIPEIELLYGESENIISILSNVPESEIESISWSPSTGLSCTDCLNPLANPSQDVLYTLDITTKNGCETSAQIQFRVDREINVYIPNAFSPNVEDGINDVFMIHAKDGVVLNINSFQIYDRWGNKLFVDNDFLPNDPDHAWDGSYREEKMDPGVFIYFAEITLIDGTVEVFKGDVSLLD